MGKEIDEGLRGFILPELEAVPVTSGHGCTGCYFQEKHYTYCEIAKCDDFKRKDKQNVIFVEVKR